MTTTPDSTIEVPPNMEFAALHRVLAKIDGTLAGERPGSGTESEIARGTHYLAKKVVEEAHEFACAAEYQWDDATAEEAQQLIYRIVLLLRVKGIAISEVMDRL